jgi:N-acetylglutamate synthase-like GNAT family acetyltransferase
MINNNIFNGSNCMDKKENTLNNGLSIRNFTLDDVDYVITGHHTMYETEYGLNTSVWKSYVADAVNDFVNKFDDKKDCMVILDLNGTPSGSAAIKHIDDDTAQFRFFLIEPGLRGLGAGHMLFDKTIDFCREKGYKHVFLWTFSTLMSARHLYKTKGFSITETHENNEWGTEVLEEERWDMDL